MFADGAGVANIYLHFAKFVWFFERLYFSDHWGSEIEFTVHVALPKLPINYSKPVIQCKREALRGYCQWYVSRPSIYTYVVTLPFDVERPSIITLS